MRNHVRKIEIARQQEQAITLAVMMIVPDAGYASTCARIAYLTAETTQNSATERTASPQRQSRRIGIQLTINGISAGLRDSG
jgi:hypothetical protein